MSGKHDGGVSCADECEVPDNRSGA
jgi:hypothetical protein